MEKAPSEYLWQSLGYGEQLTPENYSGDPKTDATIILQNEGMESGIIEFFLGKEVPMIFHDKFNPNILILHYPSKGGLRLKKYLNNYFEIAKINVQFYQNIIKPWLNPQQNSVCEEVAKNTDKYAKTLNNLASY